MKIRQGFVSNSSSSSFVVAFPRGFTPTKKAILDYVFGDRDEVTVHWGEPDRMPVGRAASAILAQIKDQKPNDPAELTRALDGTYLPGEPEMAYHENESPEARRASLDAYYAEVEAYRQRWWTMHKPKLDPEHMDLYVIDFSDNDGDEGSILEHGDTFALVPHLQLSHH
jgi:hypothetical protein